MSWETIKYYRWWFTTGAAFLLALIVALFFFINRPINKVIIIGKFKQLNPQCINEVLTSSIKGRYWPTHRHDLLQKTQSHCAWLYQWHWHYQWPHTLIIKLQENQPQLIFNQQSLLNQNNQLFTPKHLPPQLPAVSFTGPPDQFVAMLAFYKLATPLLQIQNLSIQHLSLDNNGNMALTLNNQITLKLNQQDALNSLVRFLTVDQQLLGKPHKKIKAIDLRYPHGFAVQWQSK